MDERPSKADVESQLHQAADAMSARIESIQDEVLTTGESVSTWVRNNPLKSVGVMLAAGLTVGLVFGGSTRRRRRTHARLIDRYLDALTDEVDDAVDQGEEADRALEKALRDRVPLVVYTSESERKTGGIIRNLLGETAETFFRTLVSFLARDVVEAALANANIDEVADEDLFGGGSPSE
jgi:aspartokinase